MAPHNLPYQLHNFVPEKYKKLVTSKPITHDCTNFIRELDKYWGTDITKIIPEWKIVLENLHWSNFEYLKKIDKELENYVE